MTHLPFLSWCGHCIKGRGREEDCRKATQEERRVPEVHLDCMFMEHVGVFCCPRERDEGCVQHCGAEEIDGRVGLPRIDGVAPRNRTGVREHRRQVRQRASFDEFDRIMEQPVSDEGRFTDDRREQSSGQLEKQRNR